VYYACYSLHNKNKLSKIKKRSIFYKSLSYNVWYLPDIAEFFTPAFLSFLFLYTDRMTSRFPRISATVVKISTPARVAATPGDVFLAGRLVFPRDKLSRQLKFAFIIAILRDRCNATLKFFLH